MSRPPASWVPAIAALLAARPELDEIGLAAVGDMAVTA